MADPLLVELLTEELPPKALQRLMEAFSRGVFDGLKEKNFLGANSEPQPYATPRRLAVLISGVLDKQADRVVERKGPAVATALDAAGKPTPALLGFARSCGVEVAKLERRAGEKGEHFAYCARQKGEPLRNHLAAIVEAALKKLPVPKTMRWGAGEALFVRPVHGVILLHGRRVVPGEVLGLRSGNKTRGHRFLGKGVIAIPAARDYEKVLKQQGKVIASFEARREAIARALDLAAKKLGKGVTWSLGRHADLIDEVTNLVEFPQVYAGSFDEAFLEVPKECLIISMQQHQKYFPLADARGKLLPSFLFVSNTKPATARHVIHGNERVLRARLSDARFFYDQDRKTKLEARVPRLASVVYHNKLGSQEYRVQRLERLASRIALDIRVDPDAAQRAARLAKADLLTDMVGEFPELQGIMGRYYARHDGEPAEIAEAIEQHYWPRTAAGELPKSNLALCVALADKLDTLVGFFGIGLVPTGEKDPFGLRRAALGVIRILAESTDPIPVRVSMLLDFARGCFESGVLADSVVQDVMDFLRDRLGPYLRDRGFAPDEIDAVVANRDYYDRLDQLLPRLRALQAFRALPEAQALATANKRIGNILRQAGQRIPGLANEALFSEAAERALFSEVRSLEERTEPLLRVHDYTGVLRALAQLRPQVDDFFDRVMVMADDASIRQNRLALLFNLRSLFLQVADISRLQG